MASAKKTIETSFSPQPVKPSTSHQRHLSTQTRRISVLKWKLCPKKRRWWHPPRTAAPSTAIPWSARHSKPAHPVKWTRGPLIWAQRHAPSPMSPTPAPSNSKQQLWQILFRGPSEVPALLILEMLLGRWMLCNRPETRPKWILMSEVRKALIAKWSHSNKWSKLQNLRLNRKKMRLPYISRVRPVAICQPLNLKRIPCTRVVSADALSTSQNKSN